MQESARREGLQVWQEKVWQTWGNENSLPVLRREDCREESGTGRSCGHKYISTAGSLLQELHSSPCYSRSTLL